jgi:hypothetical protein
MAAIVDLRVTCQELLSRSPALAWARWELAVGLVMVAAAATGIGLLPGSSARRAPSVPAAAAVTAVINAMGVAGLGPAAHCCWLSRLGSCSGAGLG